MSWLFSQALVAEYLGENFLDGEQSAPLNGKPTQQAYCAPDKMTVFSRLSRFGMTYKPLMEHHGEELLKSYLAAFHVQTSASQEEAQDSMESTPPCGITWRGWLAKFDPDSYSWKTAQCSFIEDWDESLATFPASGMTRGGLLWERQMSEHRINATASGLWRTPDTGGGGDKRPAQAGQESSRERPAHPNPIGGPSEQSETLANDNDQRKLQPKGFIENERRWIGDSSWWSTEPALGRVADGVAARVDRLKAIGNGQVPLCAATAWRILSEP
jgi:hypothetical protein